jgi:uncharacterized HAD superfamily protein
MINGYDLDGVLCQNIQWSKDCELKTKKELRPYFFKLTKKLRDTEGKEVYIVTSRKEKYRSNTMSWLKKNNIFYHKLLMLEKARNRQNMIEHKLKAIQYYRIDTFYEDDPKIARQIKRKCPNVNVILVENDSSNIIQQKDLEKKIKTSKLF